MSKRFGRNQKRKLRAQLKHEQERGDNYETSWRRAIVGSNKERIRADRAIMALEQARFDLGRYCGLLPASWIDVQPHMAWDEHTAVNIDTHDGPGHYGRKSGFVEDFPELAAVRRIALPVFRAMALKKNPNFDNGCAHVRVVYDGRQWGYAISTELLYNMPRDRLANMISVQLARMIVDEFTKENV